MLVSQQQSKGARNTLITRHMFVSDTAGERAGHGRDFSTKGWGRRGNEAEAR